MGNRATIHSRQRSFNRCKPIGRNAALPPLGNSRDGNPEPIRNKRNGAATLIEGLMNIGHGRMLGGVTQRCKPKLTAREKKRRAMEGEPFGARRHAGRKNEKPRANRRRA
jgi:hypothetical protein